MRERAGQMVELIYWNTLYTCSMGCEKHGIIHCKEIM